MKVSIDHLTSTTGWTSNGTATAYAANAIPEYIADLNATSLVIKFPSGNLNKYIQKTISPAAAVTGYSEIAFYIWSRNKSGNTFNAISDFNYKLSFGGSDYYIPVYPGFNCVEMGNAATAISTIRITALHNDEDYICISEMNAVKEEFPLDIYNGIKSSLEAEIAATYPDGILIGTASCLAGATSLTLSADDFIDRFAVLKIKSGSTSEIHQVWEFDESGIKFTSMYDGATMINPYTTANVYVQLPVEFMAIEKEMIIPSIVIYGLNAERVWRGSALQDVNDTYTSTGNTIRREGAIERFYVNIHCYSRHAEIMAFLTRSVRHVINKQALWVNGFYYEMGYEGTVSDVDPNQVYDLVPQMIYQIAVEIKEEMYGRSTALMINDTNINVYPTGAGVI